MIQPRHVNLLYTKETSQKRKKFTRLIRYTIIGLGIIAVFLVVATTFINVTAKNALNTIIQNKQLIATQLAAKQQNGVYASVINNKSALMQMASRQELPFASNYRDGLAFLPTELAQLYLSHIILDNTGEGIFELKFDDFAKLDGFMKSVEQAKKINSFKSYRVDKISVNEGTPSSSIVQLKIQFK